MPARPEHELPEPGEVLVDRYRLEAIIGEGGFGAVYVARDLTLDREVAIKILRARTDDDARVLARFQREAKATAALDCEHLTTVHEIGTIPSGPAFIVMERLRGRDLHQECEDRGRIPVSEAVDWILQASLGLAHAHSVGVVHRDLKPRNLFLAHRLDGTSIVKILDFGIAKAETTAEPLTETGTLLGTPRYMAPEQIRNVRDVDARADIWALGVVLYELTTSSPIFDAEGSAGFAAHVLVEPPVPLLTRAPELPAAFAKVVHACLEKDASNRPADLDALAEALVPFATEAGRKLAPRIAKVLSASRNADAGALVDNDALALATTRREVAGPTASLSRSVSASVEANVEKSVVRSQDIPSRSTAGRSAGTGALVLVALALTGGIGWFIGQRGRGAESPVSTATAASSPIVSVPSVPSTPPLGIDVPAPTASASAVIPSSAVIPPKAAPAAKIVAADSGPSESERQKIAEACTSRAPFFLVPQNGGPMSFQCGRLAQFGCAGIRQRCATVPVTDAEKVSCRDFLAALSDREICR